MAERSNRQARERQCRPDHHGSGRQGNCLFARVRGCGKETCRNKGRQPFRKNAKPIVIVIPNALAERGRERDLTMRLERHGRQRDIARALVLAWPGCIVSARVSSGSSPARRASVFGMTTLNGI